MAVSAQNNGQGQNNNGPEQRQGQAVEVSGEFKESLYHMFGFDDFTQWSEGAFDYFYATPRTGFCKMPCCKDY